MRISELHMLVSTTFYFMCDQLWTHSIVVHICPPVDSISIDRCGQRPLRKKSSISYNLPKPFETLKSRKKFQKIGSKRTNQKVTKFPETSATLPNFVGFQIFVVRPLFAFFSFIGPFTKRVAILCSQLML